MKLHLTTAAAGLLFLTGIGAAAAQDVIIQPEQETVIREYVHKQPLASVEVPGVIEPDGKPAEYGFGWFLNSYRGHKRMWHYGETMGFRTAIQRFVDDQLTIVILCNRTDVDPTERALRVADLFLK